ncbi:hypothetical protein K2173_007887 [Erythroxylum novogranatense]|uniref:Cytochrome P450 n=1 Tax=Erythroxylum novogranatense TaxID=1862640 RepID=A0AAV8T773_9ROSI|nr:hypothetical protein K2173_007887 [Erythroxylum novogranatense]
MELLNFTLLLVLILVFKLVLQKYGKRTNKLPPSPPSLPILGHLHLVNQPMYRSLGDLCTKYGDVLLLRFGTRKVLVVSSPSAVKECFTKNDIIFSNRPRLIAGEHLHYNYRAIGFSSYGDHWRNLRRVTSMELFSTSRLNKFSKIRQEEVQLLLKKLFQESVDVKEKRVNLSSLFMELTFNVVLRMIAGKRYYGKGVADDEAKEFRDLIREYMEVHGSVNLNDIFPVLQWVDFQGIERRMIRVMKKVDAFVQHLVNEQRKKRAESSLGVSGLNSIDRESGTTLVDAMLSLQETQPELYPDEDIKAVIMEMLTAGSETSAITMDWAMSLLLNNPEAMQKTVADIEAVVGVRRLVDEATLPNLNYLQNVINETFRLYPAGPLLVPHESSEDCIVSDFHVPKGTILLVNAWKIHRNPKYWVEPEKFMPERFEGGEVERHNLVPFGAGRRICPGAALGRRTVGLTLGALIQCFEWSRISEEKIDMTEGIGLSMPKLESLEALCKPRIGMNNVLSSLR